MNDEKIVDLYWARAEQAIEETSAKYGKYCYSIAYNILADAEDAEESVNDAYLGAWNSMPPHRPSLLSAFLGKLTRRIAIDRWRRRGAAKRGGELAAALEELNECVPSRENVEQALLAADLEKRIDTFVNELPAAERRVFLCRYWYMDSVSAICRQFGYSPGKVKVMLHRTRKALRACLEKEEYV